MVSIINESPVMLHYINEHCFELITVLHTHPGHLERTQLEDRIEMYL